MQLVKSNGRSDLEPDKAANREAKKSDLPNRVLLKSRLLFDGGYYTKAYTLLSDIDIQKSWTKHDQLERIYRLGRIRHKQKNPRAALRYYEQTIIKGKNSSAYFACSAALQSGIIYEQENAIQKAKKSFEQCLDMTPNQYRSGLHQKAKAGLNRIKK